MTIVIQLMNSLKFVTQINGVYQSTSSSRRQLHQHTICQIHTEQGREGFKGGHKAYIYLQRLAAGSLFALHHPTAWVAALGLFGWRRRRALASAGCAGPLRWEAQHGPGIEGQRRPATRGSFGQRRREAPSAAGAAGPPKGHRSTRPQRRPVGGAPSAGRGAGQWPLASSIYGGWRVSS